MSFFRGREKRILKNYTEDLVSRVNMVKVSKMAITEAKAAGNNHIVRIMAIAHELWADFENSLPFQDAVDNFTAFERVCIEELSERLGINATDVIDEISANAMEFAKKNFDKALSLTENYKSAIGTVFSDSHSWMWRQMVWAELEYLHMELKNGKTSKEPQKDKASSKKKTVPIVERVNHAKVKKPGTSKAVSSADNEPQVLRDDSVLNLNKFRVNKAQKRLSNDRKLHPQDPSHLFSVPSGGWTWFCDYHSVWGVAEDEEEAQFMAGAHMHYTEIDGEVCEIYTRSYE